MNYFKVILAFMVLSFVDSIYAAPAYQLKVTNKSGFVIAVAVRAKEVGASNSSYYMRQMPQDNGVLYASRTDNDQYWNVANKVDNVQYYGNWARTIAPNETAIIPYDKEPRQIEVRYYNRSLERPEDFANIASGSKFAGAIIFNFFEPDSEIYVYGSLPGINPPYQKAVAFWSNKNLKAKFSANGLPVEYTLDTVSPENMLKITPVAGDVANAWNPMLNVDATRNKLLAEAILLMFDASNKAPIVK